MDKKSAWFFGWLVTRKGSDTSGNYGHKGRKGKKGGSLPGGGHGALGIAAGATLDQKKEAVQAHREAWAKKPEEKKGNVYRTATAPPIDQMLVQNEQINAYLDTKATSSGDWRTPTYGERGEIKHNLVTELSKRSDMEYDVTNAIIRQWSHTSNDNDYRSLSLQEACSEEFDVPLSDWQKAKIPESRTYMGQPTKTLAPRNEERRLLREMYDWTQSELAKQGFKKGDTIRMYRGLDFSVGTSGEAFTMNQNAMSSWSVGKSVADQFSGYGGGNGSVFVADIPVENILCSCLTGFGCFKEGEFLVLGVPGGEGRVVHG